MKDDVQENVLVTENDVNIENISQHNEKMTRLSQMFLKEFWDFPKIGERKTKNTRRNNKIIIAHDRYTIEERSIMKKRKF